MMKERLYYNDFYEQNWLKKIFQIFILLIILIAGACYGILSLIDVLGL